VFPGEQLIVHFENGLTGLTIRDYFSPQYTPKGQSVPIYPEQMTSSPINLHTHGAHISPKGNADNVLLHIPPGRSNTYTYDIPRNMPQGLYWYHSHLHGLTAAQVYTGRVGLLAIGRTDGNLPLVTEKSIPIRNMALQYNFVFDRAGGLAQLNNPSWPQWVSTIAPPKAGELATEPISHHSRRLTSTNRSRERSTLPSGMRGRSQFTIVAAASSSSPAIYSSSSRRAAKSRAMCRRIHRCRITSGMCNSR
jgi:multicopper oxidase